MYSVWEISRVLGSEPRRSVIRLFGLAGVLIGLFLFVGGSSGRASSSLQLAWSASGDPEAVCGPRRRGEQCGPGNGRKTRGGGEKVTHKGWPSVTGILWKVLDSHGHRKVGGPDNDELLGHHGSDRIFGGPGKDIIWGDWDRYANNTSQRDVLRGGAGNDWLYSSHGHNRIAGGPGRDYIWAYYGRGTIDCGPGNQDTVRVRLDNDYRIRNCERTKNFCGHGSKPGGGCYKPGEKPTARRVTTRQRAPAIHARRPIALGQGASVVAGRCPR